MNKVFKIVFGLLIIVNFIFASWYQLHGDILFSSDIGRDFLILREVDQKKLILIGPRASGNLFHGPGWPYLNYPFYVLGHGNPVVVGFGWVFYSAIFVAICFYIAKKLFNKSTAYLFAVFLSLFLTQRTYQMINPDGAMFFIPVFFYFFVKYYQTLRIKYLIFSLISLVILIQIELALGIPLFILGSFGILFKQIKTKNFKHIPYFLLILFGLSNFFLFDIRHNFLITHNVLEFVSPKTGGHVYNYAGQIGQRLYLAFFGINFLKQNIFSLNFLILVSLLTAVLIQIKNNKYKLIYLNFIYFYFGYFILSFIDKGPLLYFYQYPMFPLVFLIFSSLITTQFKKSFIFIFSLILLINYFYTFSEIRTSNLFIGHDVGSWKFLNSMSQTVFSGTENKFGYFVYAPDSFAYAPKYAMYYASSNSKKIAEYFTKDNVTYVTAEPPPQNQPYMKSDFWIKSQINIKATPTKVFNFANGYQIFKFNLTNEEIAVGFDKSVDPGLNFR